ncbi:scaffolding protein [Microbacterium phage Mabodamaca]|uniref:Scaffolding protein n=1 Tax=Microbacterium phage Mabodamaca TaxID=3078574 RepID=A0AA96SJB0_9CAUD|nr:scaffolding protein [Microbacterium phage Mabodamaca]
MSTTVTDPATEPDPSKETPSETHPWGDDFSPEKAWKALTAAREAEKAAKRQVTAYEAAEQERADADKTELQKAIERAEKAEKAAKDAARNAVLAKSGLPEELYGFITGETDEAIAEQIAKLSAAVTAKDKAEETPEPVTDPAPKTPRPTAALTPGHGGDEDTFDADAIVAASL